MQNKWVRKFTDTDKELPAACYLEKEKEEEEKKAVKNQPIFISPGKISFAPGCEWILQSSQRDLLGTAKRKMKSVSLGFFFFN